MMFYMIRFLLIFFLCYFFNFVKLFSFDDRSLIEGKKLPDVVVQNLSGEDVNVSQITNDTNLIVFIFWATWCGPCIKELDNISEIYEEIKNETNVEIYAVSIDDSRSRSKIGPFVKGKRWEYQFLLDPNQDFMRAMGFSHPPFSAIIDKNGNIAWTHNSYIEGDEFELADKIREISGTK